MTAAKDSPQQPIEGEAGGNPLDEVLMPPESLGQRIHADGERFRAGFEAGRDSVFLNRIAEAVESFDPDNADEATYEEVRGWIFEFADAMDLPYRKSAGVVSVAVAVSERIKELTAPPDCSCTPPDDEDELCERHGRTRKQWAQHADSLWRENEHLREAIYHLADVAGAVRGEGQNALSTAMLTECRINEMREEMNLKVDLTPGDYWVFTPQGRTAVIVTREGRLLWEQRDENGFSDHTYADLTGAYSPGMWTFEPRRGDDQ